MFLKTDGAGNLSFSSDLPTTSFTGATVETSIADSDLVLIYDDSATAVRKMTKANLVSGIGASAGQVIQVVSTTKSDTFSSSTINAFTDITGLSVSITPSSASNKILIIANVNGINLDSNAYLRLVRGSTAIGVGDTAGSRSSISGSNIHNGITYIYSILGSSFQFLDSPATTSSTTYKIQFITDVATTFINRGSTDTDALYAGRSQSTITVMEIKG